MTPEQHEQASTIYLVIQQGPQAGKRIEIWKDCTTIGRSRDCDKRVRETSYLTNHRLPFASPLDAVLTDELYVDESSS